MKSRQDKYRKKYAEILRLRHLQTYREQREKILSQKRMSYKRNRDSYLKRMRDWNCKNKDRVKDYQARSRYKIRNNLKLLCYSKLGDHCVMCGCVDIRVLSIDHIHGDGHLHRKETGKSQIRMYKDVLSDTSNRFQILCMNCQWVKRHASKEHTPKKFPVNFDAHGELDFSI